MLDHLPVADLVHTMPGRARLRIPDRRGDAVYFASIATGLSTIPGIYKVEVRPLTGSILLQHGPPIERIIHAAEEANLFRLQRTEEITSQGADLPFDPQSLVGLGLSVLALWQATEKKFLPPAVTLAWYAAHLVGLLDRKATGG
jgi:hypothetical protein